MKQKSQGRKVPPPPPIKKQTEAEMLIFEMDRGLELLVTSCERYGKEYGEGVGTKVIPIFLVREFKKRLIDGYMKGIKQNPELNKK